MNLLLPFLLAVATPGSPSLVDSRCESQREAVGIGTTRPRFSWRIESERRGERQTAYQVLVASTPEGLSRDEGDLWDSGRVSSDQSVHVEYAGKPLRSRQRAWWKVRVWDRDGQPLAWSPIARFEMGLLDQADWSALWIGVAPPAGPTPDHSPVEPAPVRWIWYPEGDPTLQAPPAVRYFRHAFVLPDRAIAGASWLLAGDNSARGWINGKPAGETGMPWDRWRLTRLPVTGLLRPGRNVLAVLAENLGAGANVGGLLQVTFADGDVQRIATGPAWRAAREGPEGWNQPDFDDGSWVPAMDLGPLEERSWELREYKSPDPAPVTYLRRSFPVRGTVRRARLYATAKGIYELHLNGRRVGEELFRPGWTDYRDRFQSQTHDVTALLEPGPNAIGVVLGEGWYSGHVAADGRMNWGRATRALVQLEIEYADGTTERVLSDESWRSSRGPVVTSDLLMGESYDARREMSGWGTPGFAASSWHGVVTEPLGEVPVVPQVGPGVRRVGEVNPVTLAEPLPGVHVYDLGQNMVGWVRLRVAGPAGTEVRLRHAEMLNPDGTLYTTNLRSARATDTYVLGGDGLEVWEPSFTFHGFRYVEVTGYPGTPRPDAVTGVVISSATDATGAFTTSSELVNQLQRNIVWGQRGNYLEVPTDCPQRDERLGWMADAQVFVRTACFNFDVQAFLAKWLQDVRDAQSPEGGFTNYAPAIVESGGSPAWADGGVIVPWTLYRCYGDTRVLERHYEAMKRFIAYVREANPDLLWVNRSAQNFGDWLNIDADAPRPVVATAYFARSTSLLAQTARVLGRDEDARQYEALFGEIRDAFRRAYVRADGRVEGGTQTVYLLALAFDLLPEALRPLAAEHLVADLEKRDVHLSTGFVGVGLLNPVLTGIGRIDLAYRLLLNETFPSWGYSIRQGATTIWERWDGWTEEKGFQDPSMNSFNHYSLGSVGEWMYAVVAGIDLDPEVPGYKHSVLWPRPGGGLTRADGALRTQYGRIRSSWRIEDGTLRWEVEVPPNTTATLHVPTSDPASVTEGGRPVAESDGLEPVGPAAFEAGSGRYVFEAKP